MTQNSFRHTQLSCHACRKHVRALQNLFEQRRYGTAEGFQAIQIHFQEHSERLLSHLLPDIQRIILHKVPYLRNAENDTSAGEIQSLVFGLFQQFLLRDISRVKADLNVHQQILACIEHYLVNP